MLAANKPGAQCRLHKGMQTQSTIRDAIDTASRYEIQQIGSYVEALVAAFLALPSHALVDAVNAKDWMRMISTSLISIVSLSLPSTSMISMTE